MSTEKLRTKPRVSVRISKNSLKARKDENGFNKDNDDVFDRQNGGYKGKFKKNVNFGGMESNEEKGRGKFYERGKIGDDRENGYKGKLKKNVNFRGMELGEEKGRGRFYGRGEIGDDRENGYKGKLKKNVNFRGMESNEEMGRGKFYGRGEIDDDRGNGYKGKMKNRVNFRGIELGEESGREKFRERGKVATYRDSLRNRDGEVFYGGNGYKGMLKKNVEFRGEESDEGRSGEVFRERRNVRSSRSLSRSRNDENGYNKDEVFDRGNGYKGKLKKNVSFRGMESSEERSGERFIERGKLKTLDSFGKRKKRVYADEGMDESGKIWSGGEKSKKKTFFKKEVRDEPDDGETDDRTIRDFGKLKKAVRTKDKKKTLFKEEEKEVTDETDDGETDDRTIWDLGKLKKAARSKNKKKTLLKKEEEEEVTDETDEGKTDDRTIWDLDKIKKAARSKDKPSKPSLKDKKEIDEIDDSGSGLKIGEKKIEFTKDKPGLDEDAKNLEDRPWKKKKRVIKIDPYDISNKRVYEPLVVNGIDVEKKKDSENEEKKKDSEKEPGMSQNAQFRAIQPSPSILTFVEKNLLGRRRMIDIKRAGYNIELPFPLDNIPFSKSSERENIEENIFRNKLEFFAAAKVSSSFPPPNLPEIAFAGRSNVGKSSLLNALTRQWGVVRTSDKPGHTQTINFFNLGTKLSLVDLPGYGFAYAKEEVKESWEELVKEYVQTRVGLKRVCLLIDTKWGMKPRDLELIELMERSKTKYQIVLTKTDTVFPIDVARRAMQIEESLLPNKSVVQPLMMASSKSGAGIRSLRTVLANVARFVKK